MKYKGGLTRSIFFAPPLAAIFGTFLIFTLATGSPISAADSLALGYRGPFGAFNWFVMFTVLTYFLSVIIVYPILVGIRRSRGTLRLRHFLIANLSAASVVIGLYLGVWFAMDPFVHGTLVASKTIGVAMLTGGTYGTVCGYIMFWMATPTGGSAPQQPSNLIV